MRLNNKVALITGSGHGIGRGTALAFAREGAKVVINDLAREPSTGHAEAVAQLIRAAGGEVEVVFGDASDTADMQRVVASVVERYGRLDILVNNANPGRRDPNASRTFLEISEDQLYQGYFLPFKAAYVNTQLAARQMIQQGSPGAVITITSVHQERAWGWDSIYGSMKAALRRLVMSQARELAPHKIRVNAIAPGFMQHSRRDRNPARARQTVRYRRGGGVPGVGRGAVRHRHLPARRRRHAAAPNHGDLGGSPARLWPASDPGPPGTPGTGGQPRCRSAV